MNVTVILAALCLRSLKALTWRTACLSCCVCSEMIIHVLWAVHSESNPQPPRPRAGRPAVPACVCRWQVCLAVTELWVCTLFMCLWSRVKVSVPEKWNFLLCVCSEILKLLLKQLLSSCLQLEGELICTLCTLMIHSGCFIRKPYRCFWLFSRSHINFTSLNCTFSFSSSIGLYFCFYFSVETFSLGSCFCEEVCTITPASIYECKQTPKIDP